MNKWPVSQKQLEVLCNWRFGFCPGPPTPRLGNFCPKHLQETGGYKTTFAKHSYCVALCGC